MVFFFGGVYDNRFLIKKTKSLENSDLKEQIPYPSAKSMLALFSSLLLMNFLFISVSYSKKEIGILRGLGARNIDVLKIFAEEGLIISLINGAIASVVAIIGCLIINGQFAKALGYNVAILNISPVQPLLILACCLISSLLACALPILKNANKKPIDTINNH